MILAHFGLEVDEGALRDCCRTTIAGTRADDVVACAYEHGFDAEHVRGADLAALQRWLAEGIVPIILLNTYPIDAVWRMHAVLLLALDAGRALLLDPVQGERAVATTAFDQAWQMNLRRVVLVRPRTPR
jgi:ABC-type bacteriocin/lantibiotic exporter with double-glycine peptidase domain